MWGSVWITGRGGVGSDVGNVWITGSEECVDREGDRSAMSGECVGSVWITGRTGHE